MRACNLKIFIYYKMLIVEMQSNKDKKKKTHLRPETNRICNFYQ